MADGSGAVRRPRRSILFGLAFIVTLLVTIAYYTYGAVVVDFNYRREVGGHVRNAYEVNTPEAMIRELNLTLSGMRRLGLREGMYAAYFPWERTPDRSMSFQYEFIDQLINRTEAVILWRSLAYNGNTTPETLGDVYEQKMDNLRSFMIEGCDASVCTDWIARDVYLLNIAPAYYFSGSFGAGSTLVLVMSAALFILGRAREKGLDLGRSRSRTSLPPEVARTLARWVVLPLYALGLVLMILPYVLGALRL